MAKTDLAHLVDFSNLEEVSLAIKYNLMACLWGFDDS